MSNREVGLSPAAADPDLVLSSIGTLVTIKVETGVALRYYLRYRIYLREKTTFLPVDKRLPKHGTIQLFSRLSWSHPS